MAILENVAIIYFSLLVTHNFIFNRLNVPGAVLQTPPLLITLYSNPNYRADTKEFVVIMHIFIILSD